MLELMNTYSKQLMRSEIKRKRVVMILLIFFLAGHLHFTSSQTIERHYFDVYTCIEPNSKLKIQLVNNTSQDINPFIVIYTDSPKTSIMVNGISIYNGSNTKISISAKSGDRLEMKAYEYWLIMVNKISRDANQNSAELVDAKLVDQAFQIGVMEVLIALFPASIFCAIIIRRWFVVQ